MPVPFHANIAFNAHHSPMGAYFSFTCGHFGSEHKEHRGGGGLGVQLGKPASQDLFIGIKDGDRYAPVPLQVLPFFDGADQLDPRAAYTQQAPGTDPQRFAPYTRDQLTREYGHATDRWKTADFEFSIYTPFGPIPNPAAADAAALRDALLPAITAELIVDNRYGKNTKTAFLAINFHEGGTRILDTGLLPNHVGFALKANLGVAAHVVDLTKANTLAPAAFAFLRWWPHEGLEDRSNPIHLLGTTPGIGVEVPPGKSIALRFSIGCHLPEIVTTRLEGRYFYNRYYASLLDVLNAASARFCDLKRAAKTLDEKLAASGLSPDQQFLIAHATRSYYANTELLEVEGDPYWIVNEGEYCMMNTLDLAVDQVFWELEQNPWVVKNLLDNFMKRYSYVDQVKIPTTESTENTETTTTEKNSVNSVSSVVQNVFSTAPGGLSFCHDQGSHNQFSPFGHSAYELKDLTGCFSYMTREQLLNWILIAASYVVHTKDIKWGCRNECAIRDCFNSMLTRREGAGDYAGEGKLLDRESALCGLGREITTYDSLDESLGQAQNNLYFAMKTWAAYHAIRFIGYTLHVLDTEAHFAANEIEKLGPNIAAYLNRDNYLAAIFDQRSPGFSSRILPAIEPLIYTLFWSTRENIVPPFSNPLDPGAAETASMASALRTHTITLLSDIDRRNHFPDGGIKLSSTSDNSWLSKIAIVQHVARTLFNLDEDGNERLNQSASFGAATVGERLSDPHPSTPPLPHGRGSDSSPVESNVSRATGWEKSDAAHVAWLTTGPGAYWAASDQIVNGRAQGSRYYPRLITTALWLTK